jgi:hypothetical protein
LQIEGRAADDLEHVAGRGLVFERFFEIARASLQFAEQPRILHRDDRLVGKGAHQFDLPLGERFHPLPGKHDDADRLAGAQQRHSKHRARFAERHSLGHRVFWIDDVVGDMDYLPFEDRPPADALVVGPLRVLSDPCGELGRKTAVRHRRIDFAVAAGDQSHIGRAQPGRGLDKRFEYLLQIEG